MSSIVAYADQELTLPDQARFEARLDKEPELARALQDYLDGADLGSALASRGLVRPSANRYLSPLRRAWVIGAAAAAVLLALVIGLRALGRSQVPVSFQAAALATGYDLREYNRSLGLEPDRIPIGNQTVRGGQQHAEISADEYLQAVGRAEERRISDALRRGADATEAAFFVIPVRVSTDASAIVIQIGASEPPAVRFPSVQDGVGKEHRLVADRVHVLPEPVVSESGQSDRVHEGRKFTLGPRLEGRAVREPWLVAVRAQPLTPALLGELNSFAASLAPKTVPAPVEELKTHAAKIEEWLQARGFAVRCLLLSES